MSKCKHSLTSLVEGNTGYFCKDCGNRVDDTIASLILEAETKARIDELNYWTHRGSGQIEMSAEQVTKRLSDLLNGVAKAVME